MDEDYVVVIHNRDVEYMIVPKRLEFKRKKIKIKKIVIFLIKTLVSNYLHFPYT